MNSVALDYDGKRIYPFEPPETEPREMHHIDGHYSSHNKPIELSVVYSDGTSAWLGEDQLQKEYHAAVMTHWYVSEEALNWHKSNSGNTSPADCWERRFVEWQVTKRKNKRKTKVTKVVPQTVNHVSETLITGHRITVYTGVLLRDSIEFHHKSGECQELCSTEDAPLVTEPEDLLQAPSVSDAVAPSPPEKTVPAKRTTRRPTSSRKAKKQKLHHPSRPVHTHTDAATGFGPKSYEDGTAKTNATEPDPDDIQDVETLLGKSKFLHQARTHIVKP